MKFIKSILTVVKEMKKFSNREIIFLIDVVLEKGKTVLFIKLGIQNVIDISSLIAIFSKNRLLRFLLLTRQKVSDYMTQKKDMEYRIYFHKCGKFRLDYQKVFFENMFNWKRTDMLII